MEAVVLGGEDTAALLLEDGEPAAVRLVLRKEPRRVERPPLARISHT
jgi:hypothetical protein